MASFSDLHDNLNVLEIEHFEMAQRLLQLNELFMDDDGSYRWVSTGKLLWENDCDEIPF